MLCKIHLDIHYNLALPVIRFHIVSHESNSFLQKAIERAVHKYLTVDSSFTYIIVEHLFVVKFKESCPQYLCGFDGTSPLPSTCQMNRQVPAGPSPPNLAGALGRRRQRSCQGGRSPRPQAAKSLTAPPVQSSKTVSFPADWRHTCRQSCPAASDKKGVQGGLLPAGGGGGNAHAKPRTPAPCHGAKHGGLLLCSEADVISGRRRGRCLL